MSGCPRLNCRRLRGQYLFRRLLGEQADDIDAFASLAEAGHIPLPELLAGFLSKGGVTNRWNHKTDIPKWIHVGSAEVPHNSAARSSHHSLLRPVEEALVTPGWPCQ